MARNKRTSDILEKAEVRAAKIGTIDKDPDLGNGLTLGGFKQLIEEFRASLKEYNAILANVDEVKNRVDANEKKVAEAYSQSLIGVAAKYGKNSNEYEKAGGVRKEERKAPTRKPKADTSK